MNLDVIYTEDCLPGLRKHVPDNSIDLQVCDPQYGWGFMGKDWDQAVPSVGIWQQCFRVLKPGAFAFIMSGPRLDCLIENGMRIREAGFNISFSPIFWAYASGFPKAQNIGKVVDKRLGAKRIRVKNPVGNLKPWRDSESRIDIQETIPDNNPITFQAQALDGSYSGMQLKPAVEVVIVAMKPLSEKTYVDQALANGKGITWLDEGRIPYKSAKNEDLERGRKRTYYTFNKIESKQNYECPQGRFPANLLVSDDCLNDGKILKSGGGSGYRRYKNSYFMSEKQAGYLEGNPPDSSSFSRYFSLDAWWEKRLKELPESVRRTFPFLIVPKASKSEKNKNCEELYWEKDKSSFGYHQIGRKRWEWLGREEERIYKKTGKRVSLRARGNIHPTVKPLKLGSYLVTLGSRRGDTILDPFGGSGWMAIVAKSLGRHYVVFETEKENVKIAKTRLSEIQLEMF